MSNAQAIKIGQNFNHAIKAIGTDVHRGKLPQSYKMIEIFTENVVVSGIKKAEKGDAIIFRLFETEGQSRDVKISLSEKIFGKMKSAIIVDLMERPSKDVKVELKNGYVKFPVKKYNIVSLKINFN